MVRAADQSAADAHVSAHVTHLVDDCTALSFEDEVFDACYCERVFQHLGGKSPARAAAEMLRVLKPGGRFVLVDTDWSTLAINANRADLERRVVAAVSKAFPNPKAGQRLREQVIEAGAIDVRVEVSAFDIGPAGGTAALLTKTAAKALSGDELSAWLASLEGARLLQLPYAHLTMTVVAGIKPSGAI
jgi:SAM-dependent methyltransferase